MMGNITIETRVHASIEKVWKFRTSPEHIIHWNHASEEWHAPREENDLRIGETFSFTMEAKNGSEGFDFTGTYDDIKENKTISYTISDGKKVSINFSEDSDQTKITETFEAEKSHPVDMQKAGWQAIMDDFKKYTETK
ncbi:MAG: SRPBCC domain-containing protein [Ginsengibacter sp.]